MKYSKNNALIALLILLVSAAGHAEESASIAAKPSSELPVDRVPATADGTAIDQQAVVDTNQEKLPAPDVTAESAVPSATEESASVPTASSQSLNQQIPAPDKTDAGVMAQGDVSKGERIEIDGKGFSIVAPMDWIVQRNLARSSLYLQAQNDQSGYLRNISVVRFKGPKIINEITAEEFANKLIKTFPSVSSTIQNYELRNRQSIEMADGRQGFLFYTDFEGSGRKMMQAHVLLSSETNHYLVTYTDVLEHFESSADGSQFLSEAWAAMTSIQLDSPSPMPDGGLGSWIVVIAVAMIAVAGGVFARQHFAGKKYRAFGNLGHGEASEADMVSGISQVEKSETEDALESQISEFQISEINSTPVKSPRIVEFAGRKQSASASAQEIERDEIEFSDDVTPVDQSKTFKKGA